MVISLQTISETHLPSPTWSLEEMEKIPHLQAVAKSFREAIGATHKNIRDIKLQNLQDYESIITALNNNLILRLLVTQQYHLLLNLFKDPEEKARWIRFIAELQAQEINKTLVQQQQQIWMTTPPIRTNTLNIPIYSTINQVMFLWTHPDPKLSNLEKWTHYEREMQRITHEYHGQRVRILNQSLHREEDHIDRLVNVLKKDEVKNSKAIGELVSIKEELVQKRQEIMTMPVDSPQSAALQDTLMTSLHEDILARRERVLEEYGVENAEINELRAQRNEEVAQTVEDIKQVDKVFEEQRVDLNTHLERERDLTKEAALSSLDNLTVIMKKWEGDFNPAILKLESFQKRINEAETVESFQGILKECQQEFKTIKNSLSAENYRNIEAEIHTIEKMVEHEQQDGLVNEVKLAQEPPLEEKHGLAEPAEVKVPSNILEAAAPEISLAVEVPEEVKENEVKVDEEQKHSVEVQSGMKNELAGMRNQAGFFSHPVDRDEQAFIKARDLGFYEWMSFQKTENFSEEEMVLVNETERLIVEAKNYNSSKELPHETLSTILNNLDELGEEHEGTHQVIEQFKIIKELAEQELANHSISFGRSV